MEQLQLNDFLNYKFLSAVQYAPNCACVCTHVCVLHVQKDV